MTTARSGRWWAATMLYTWGGRQLLEDAVVERKRSVADGNGEEKCYALELRRWIAPRDDALLRSSFERLRGRHQVHITHASQRKVNDVRAKIAWYFVVEQIASVADDHRHDFWQLPEETLCRREGDCEDKSFLAASLMVAAGVPDDRVRVVVGAVLRRTSRGGRRRLIGHAWPIYRRSAGEWCLLETHLRHLPVRTNQGRAVIPGRVASVDEAEFVPIDYCALDERSTQYVPLFCFNKLGVWTVEETEPNRLKGAQVFQPDWSQQPTFRELWSRERRLPTHGLGDCFNDDWPG